MVEYTVTNETTLGSALRVPGLDHDAVNRAAGRPQAVLAGDKRFMWQEKVKW